MRGLSDTVNAIDYFCKDGVVMLLLDFRMTQCLAEIFDNVSHNNPRQNQSAVHWLSKVGIKCKTKVIGNHESTMNESFEAAGMLDCPQWTRPAEFRDWNAPDLLLGGNRAEIRKWRKQAALEKTMRLRPDLLAE